MKYTHLLYYVIVFLLFTGKFASSFAQDIQSDLPVIFPKNPDASSLIKSIIYPVNYSTGLAQIEVPIYEIKLKDGTILPIKLTYHGSGFKPSEVKQRIGIGWTLQVEPQITPSVNGNPDEWFYDQWDGKGYGPGKNMVESVYGGRPDFQPDQYFYRLLNSSGSFFYLPDGAVTVPYDPIIIKGKFDITDSNGYKYKFVSTDETCVARQYDGPVVERLKYSSLYKAKTITSPYNENITFEYDEVSVPTTVNGYTDKDYCYIERDLIENQCIISLEAPDPSSFPPAGLNTNLGYYPEDMKYMLNDWNSKNITPTKYGPRLKFIRDYIYNEKELRRSCYFVNRNLGLNSIVLGDYSMSSETTRTREVFGHLLNMKFPGGNIEFVNKNSSFQLDYILIKDNEEKVIRKIKFYSQEVKGDIPRILLDSINFMNNEDEKEYGYKFNYHVIDENPLPSADPRYSDPWGYWARGGSSVSVRNIRFPADEGTPDTLVFKSMGSDIYKSFTPSDTWENEIYTPDIEELELYEDEITQQRQHLMLESIIYPTGGKCEFNYEPHRFVKWCFDSPEIKENPDVYPHGIPIYYYPGGLRIKQINYLNSDDQLIHYRLYKYGKNEDGCGIPYMELKDEDFIVTENRKFINITEPVFNPIHNVYISNTCTRSNDTYEFRMIVKSKPIHAPLFEQGASMLYEYVTEYYEEVQGKSTLNSGKTVYKYDLTEIEKIRPFRHTMWSGGRCIYTPFMVENSNQWKIGQLVSVEKWQKEKNVWSRVSYKDYKYKIFTKNNPVTLYRPLSQEAIEYNIPEASQIYCMDIHNPGRKHSLRISMKAGEYNRYFGLGQEYFTSSDHVIYPGVKLLEEEKDSIDGVISLKKYRYGKNDDIKHLNPVEIQLDDIEYNLLEKYTYSGDNIGEMQNRNILNHLVCKEKWHKGRMVLKNKNEYGFFENGMPLSSASIPSNAFPALKDLISGRDESSLEVRIQYKQYDSFGNPVYLIKDGLTQVVYLWGYAGQHPIAEIKNVTYDDVLTSLSGEAYINELLVKSKLDTSDINKLNNLRHLLPDADITTMVYEPLVGIKSICDPRGYITYYEYDSFNRLKRSYIIENGIEKTLEMFDYNYLR